MLSRSRALALSTTVLLGSTLASGETAMTTVKALADAPLRYANQPVTVTGRFRGRQPPRGQDAGLSPGHAAAGIFSCEMEDAAVWVSGIRPAGWDFDLDPRSAADATRGPWLEVTGTVPRRTPPRHAHRRSGLKPATCVAPRRRGRSVAAASCGRPAPRAALVFQDPLPGEDDVPRETAVRLQFSRAILPETLSEHVSRLVRIAAPARRSADPAVHGALRSRHALDHPLVRRAAGAAVGGENRAAAGDRRHERARGRAGRLHVHDRAVSEVASSGSRTQAPAVSRSSRCCRAKRASLWTALPPAPLDGF